MLDDVTIRRTITTASKSYDVEIDEAIASQIIQWDEDGDLFVSDLSDRGFLDTAPRDYFGMALIEVLLPGPPSVQDELLFGINTNQWHWPCFGSSSQYKLAFVHAWEEAKKKLKTK